MLVGLQAVVEYDKQTPEDLSKVASMAYEAMLRHSPDAKGFRWRHRETKYATEYFLYAETEDNASTEATT